MRALRFCAVLVCVFTLISPRTPSQRSDLPSDFDGYVARVLKAFDVPGVSVAIVRGGRVALAKGYGVRKLGESTPVNAQTLFSIASNTKLFTATAVGLLVEEGKLAWDAPVITYLPWFQMWDPYVTRELTVRDLLVHRSGLGLGAGDLLWWPTSNLNRKEITRRLRFIRPAASFRSAFAYDNLLYLAAGEAHRSRQRSDVGGFRGCPHPAKSGDGDEHRPGIGNGEQRRNRACGHQREGSADSPIRQRRHESGRRHTVER